MSEKVLGFKQKEGVYHKEDFQWKVYEDDLVLVNLKSESVTLEWLEKYCKSKSKYEWNLGGAMKNVIEIDDLLLAAKKGAGK